MFLTGMSPHIISLLVLTTLAVSAWADDDEDKLIITVEVKRNNMSIEWNETLSDTNGKEFKEMSLAVKTQLSKDLKELSVNQIKVKSFKPKEGNTFCEFECRVNSKAVTKEDIEKVLNMIVEIGVEKRQLQQSQDQKDEPPVGVIVFAALILCAMIIAFVVVVLRRNWRLAKEHAPEASFESYRQKKHRPVTALVTEEPDVTPASYTRRTDSIVLEVDERPVSDS